MRIIKAARGNITGHFGDTDVPGANVKRHTGTDIGHGEQTADDLAVHAPQAGKVTAAGWQGTYGNRIIIDHGDDWETLLAHLAAILVSLDQDVNLNDLVGVMGGTGGNWPVHLHQELRYKGVPVDAEQHFTSLAQLNPTPIKKRIKMDILFARGDKSADVYRIDLKTMLRTYVPGEAVGVLTTYQQNGGVIATIPQGQLDSILKEAGSR